MSVAGTAGDRTLSGVKAGVLGKGSSEAVNGAQLFATNANVEANAGNISKNGEKIATNAADIATNKATIAVNAAGIKNVGDNVSGMASSLGGGASVDANGKFVAPTYSVQGKQANTVGEALAALNGGVDVNKDNITQNTASISKNAADITTNKTSIANITKDINSGNVGLVKQDAESLALTVAAGTGGSTMSVAGTAGDRTLSGVKAGVLGKGSSEAVNGAQLFATNANVEANAGNISKNGEKIATNAADIATNKATIALNTSDIVSNKTNIAANTAGIKNVGDNVSGMASSLGGGASVDANGKFVAPSYSVQGLKVNSVGGALTALNDGVDTNKTSIANITKDIDSGNVGLVKQDAESLALTVAAGTGGSTMSVAGTAGDRTLSGVKAGVLGKGSSEAVNGAQLFATNANVETNAGNISKNGEKIATNAADIATNKATIAVNAAGIKNVGDNVSGMALSLGGGASVDANGKFVAPTYSVQGKQANTVGEALAALNGGVDVNKDNITQNTASISKNAADITTNKTSIVNITKDINSGNVGLVKQDAESLALTVAAGTGGSTMSVAGTAGDRTLSGVKAGVLGKGSSEAVNGAQLFATNANVEANAGNISENGKKIATNAADIATNKATIALNTSDIVTNKTNIAANTAGIKNVGDNVSGMALSLGGGASVDANGKFAAPSYSVQGLKVNSVGGALTALNDGVDTNKTSIANITKDIDSGNVGLVKQDAESLALTVAAGTGGTTMSVAGTAGDRTLSGVKAGVLGKGSSEAVNGAQLFATNANVETNAGNISKNGEKIATNAADIATNKATIALNTSDIVTNKTNIAANTAGIKNVGDNVSGMASSLGGGASVDANGKFVAPSYSVQGLKVNSVGGALTALNDGVDTNKTSIANITKDINSGNVGLVKQDAESLALTVAAGTGG